MGLIEPEEAQSKRDEIWKRLEALRLGPFGEKRLAEKANILVEYEERIGVPITLD